MTFTSQYTVVYFSLEQASEKQNMLSSFLVHLLRLQGELVARPKYPRLGSNQQPLASEASTLSN